MLSGKEIVDMIRDAEDDEIDRSYLETAAYDRDLDDANAQSTSAFDVCMLGGAWFLAGFADGGMPASTFLGNTGGRRAGVVLNPADDSESASQAGESLLRAAQLLYTYRSHMSNVKTPTKAPFLDPAIVRSKIGMSVTLNLDAGETSLYVKASSGKDDGAENVKKAIDAIKKLFPEFDGTKPVSLSITHAALKSKGKWGDHYGNSESTAIQVYEYYLQDLFKINYTFSIDPDIASDGRAMTCIIQIKATVDFPQKFLDYVIVMNKGAPTSVAFFYQWLNVVMKEWTKSWKSTWPMRIIDPRMTADKLSRAMTNFPSYRPRVNAQGWTMLGDGTPFKLASIETGRKLVEYADAYETAFQDYERETDPKEKADKLKVLATIPSRILGGRVLLTDWVNDNLLHATTQGEVTVTKLNEARTFEDDMLFRYLDIRIIDVRVVRSLGQLCSRLDSFKSGLAQKGSDDPVVDQRSLSRIFAILVAPQDSGPTSRYLTLANLCGQDLDDLPDTPAIDALKEGIEIFRSQFASLLKYEEEISKSLVDATRFGLDGFLFEIIGTMTKERYDTLRQAQARVVTSNSPTALPDKLQIPNVTTRPGAFEFVTPHQKSVLSSLASRPKRAMVAVDAGGGKTIITVLDILLNLKSAVRRPLVVCPPALVHSWITEINTVCQGKINVVQFSPAVLDDLFTRAGITTTEGVLKWANGLPRNTIFVSGLNDFMSRRKLFNKDGDIPAPEYFNHAADPRQFLQLTAAMGFDYVAIDESQFVKNKSTKRFVGAAYIASRAKYLRLLSGTMVVNTVVDMHGQMSMLDPSSVGTLEQFQTRYGISGSGSSGIIADPENMRLLNTDINRSVSRIVRKKSDWAYMLPQLKTQIIRDVPLTLRQSQFYDLLMEEAVATLRIKLARLKKGEGDEDDDDAADEEEREDAIQVALQSSLARAEQFLVAPDADAQYMQWQPGDDPSWRPTGDDLVSPKVRAVDKLLDDLLSRGTSAKILVFGYHKKCSVHFLRHSKHANGALHYTAENKEAIRTFKEDPNVRLMVCDEKSIQVGQNLQIADTIIRMQTVWSPGDYEQAISRIYRPDPRGTYRHEFVNHYWILSRTSDNRPTFDVCKTSRFFSKAYNNAQLENYANNDGGEWLRRTQAINSDSVPLVKMSVSFLTNHTWEEADDYAKAWAVYENYNNWAANTKTLKIAADVANQTGKVIVKDGKVVDYATLFSTIFTKVEEEKPGVAGAKKVYVPWLAGAKPPDPLDLGLTLFNDETVKNIYTNQVVWTEFGPAVVTDVLATGIKVMAADGEKKLPYARVAYAPDPDAQKRLNAIMRNPTEHILLPPNSAPSKLFAKKYNVQFVTNTNKKAILVDPKEEQDEAAPNDVGKDKKKLEPPPLEKGDVTIIAQMMDGMPGLAIPEDIGILSDAPEKAGKWIRVKSFVTVIFANHKGAENFVKVLGQKFKMAPETQTLLQQGLLQFKNGNKLTAVVRPTPKGERSFYIGEHKKLPPSKDPNKPFIRPMWMTANDSVRLAFSVAAHDPKVILWLTRKAKTQVQGVKTIAMRNHLWVSLFRSMAEANGNAKALQTYLKGEGYTVDIRETLTEIKDLAQLIRTTVKSGKPQVIPATVTSPKPGKPLLPDKDAIKKAADKAKASKK